MTADLRPGKIVMLALTLFIEPGPPDAVWFSVFSGASRILFVLRLGLCAQNSTTAWISFSVV